MADAYEDEQLEEVIKLFAKRFVNHRNAYGVQTLYGNRCIYLPRYEPITMKIITSHLRGGITISIPALDEQNNGLWICFDSDRNDGSLDHLETFLLDWGWLIIREGKRPGRDGHLWLFFDAPIPGEHLVNLANAMLKFSGLSNAGLEIFPKQSSANKLANGVRLPLGVHRKPGADNCRGLFAACPEMTIAAQLKWFTDQALNDSSDGIKLAEVHRPIVCPVSSKVYSQIKTNFKRINILEYVQAKRIGKEHVAQCPLCAIEGHDRHKDNLHINPDGSTCCCWYGGAGKIHKTADVIKALKRLAQV